MKTIVYDKTTDRHDLEKKIQVTTVTLSPDIDDPTMSKFYMFHCWKCGGMVTQFNGTVSHQVPDITPLSKFPVIIRCPNHRCKQKFIFVGLAEV